MGGSEGARGACCCLRLSCVAYVHCWQVKEVPWPYTSKQQFDKTHSMPVGRHWNTEGTYQHLIKPRVTTKTGGWGMYVYVLYTLSKHCHGDERGVLSVLL